MIAAEYIGKIVATGETAGFGNVTDRQLGFRKQRFGSPQPSLGEIIQEAKTGEGFEPLAEIGLFHVHQSGGIL